MEIIKKIESAQKPLIIITEHVMKHEILKTLSEKKVFKPMRFLTKRDLFEKVFFSYDDRALHQASLWSNKKPRVIEPWMSWLYTIETTRDYHSETLIMLQKLKASLLDNQAITVYAHGEKMFKNTTVLVMLDGIDDLTDRALNIIASWADIVKVPYDKPPKQKHEYWNHDNDFDEVAQTAIAISHLIHDGTHPENIAIVLNNPETDPLLNHIFSLFKLPLDRPIKHPLMAFKPAMLLLEHLKNSSEDNAYDALHQALEKIKPPFETTASLRVHTKIIQTLSPLIMLDMARPAFIHHVEHKLSTTTVRLSERIRGVQVKPIQNLNPFTDHHVFILGCNESTFPRTKVEDDILSPKDKKTIGRFTANEANQVIKKSLENKLLSLPHVVYSHSASSLKESHMPSTFLDTLKVTLNLSEKSKHAYIDQPFAEAFDRHYVKIKLDRYTRVHERDEALESLYPMFASSLTPYDNRFTPLSEQTRKRLIPDTLSLSYTKLNTYFKCKFHFMVEHLLKVSPPTERLNLLIGNFFHQVLENTLDEETLTIPMIETLFASFETSIQPALNAKERFFITHSFTVLKKVFDVIKTQYTASHYQPYDTETVIEKQYHLEKTVRFKGVIDKIMARETPEKLKLILIDYKTGKPTLKLPHVLYGFDAQLAFYLVLIKAHFKDTPHQITGFYEQQVLPRPLKKDPLKDYDTLFKEALSLVGYTLEDNEEVLKIDREAHTDSFIRNMRFKTDGTFYKQVKTYTASDLDHLINHVDTMIESAIRSILKGDFTIDPKLNGAANPTNNDLSCTYCPFKDVCYKRQKDYQSLDIPKTDDLFVRIREATKNGI